MAGTCRSKQGERRILRREDPTAHADAAALRPLAPLVGWPGRLDGFSNGGVGFWGSGAMEYMSTATAYSHRRCPRIPYAVV